MYRLAYYRFGEVRTSAKEPMGYDSVRKCEIGLKSWDLKYYREAYSSTRWLVRIFEVLPETNRDDRMKGRSSRYSSYTPEGSTDIQTPKGAKQQAKKDADKAELDEQLAEAAELKRNQDPDDGTTKASFASLGNAKDLNYQELKIKY